MQVTRIATTDQLQRCSASWNCLTRGVPFRSWEWLSTWWEHYGIGRELFVLTVHDDFGNLIGLLPLFRERSTARGRVLQLLGSGEVCTDYVTVLSTNEHEDLVIEALAIWLISACSGEMNASDQWDLLELDGVPTNDAAMAKLVGTLSEAGCGVRRQPALNCWKLPLPSSWEELHAGLSKNRRKAFRRLQRDVIDRDRLEFKMACSDDEFHWAMKLFIDLHQKRRISLGEPGCFASKPFSAFIDSVSQRLWDAGMLELTWIELDGHPAAIDYSLVAANAAYGYQSGLDPEATRDSPGHLMTIAVVRHAIASSRTTYDFLRGDEPYKADWRAQPQSTVNLRISANQTSSHLREGVWLAGTTMKNWIRGGLTLTGMQ
ncbi:MAG: GNAT family N-acetyltransferase [Planctomycetes bacterium]|nr:GNAT family N-acetyltransferase [Planctomycetota bacterium]